MPTSRLKLLLRPELVLFFIGGWLLLAVIPRFDPAAKETGGDIGLLTAFGAGAALILLTGLLIALGVKRWPTAPRRFFLFVFLYNALVVLVKFTFAPLSLYEVEGGEYLFLSSIGDAPAVVLLWLTPVIFALYALAFWLIYQKARTHVVPKTSSVTASKWWWLRIAAFVLLLGFLVSTGLWVGPVLFLGGPALEYLSVIFETTTAVLTLISLTVAVVLAAKAFAVLAEDVNIVQNTTLLASFFWFGIGLLAVYHALWVVYMLVVVSIWPLRFASPK